MRALRLVDENNEEKKSRLRSWPSFLSNVAKLKELTPFKQLSILTLLAWEKLKNIHKAEIKLKPFRPFLVKWSIEQKI